MPIHRDPEHRRQLLRRVIAVRGEMTFMLECRPRFDYGRAKHTTLTGETGATFSSDDLRLALVTSVGLRARRRRRPCGVPPRRRRERGLQPREGGGRAAAGARLLRRGGRRVRGHRALLARVAGALDLQGALARDGEPLRAHAEAAHVPPDGCDRRRADHEPPGAARRRAQLGLPLHLDPRRRVLALRAPSARVHRGGRGVHALAHRPVPRVGRPRRRAAPDHVRHRRPRRPRGDDARPLRGLPRIGARPDRERRRRPAPARHLRRADRLGLPVQQVRRADLL